MNKIFIFSLFLLSSLFIELCSGQNKIDVTYIANAGFLIESGDKKIIIDALFKNGWNNYLIPEDSVVTKIINQQAPFNEVSLMLITHNHKDHFNDSMVATCLNNNFETDLIAPPLVANTVLKNPYYNNNVNQIVILDKINRDKNDTTINGIRVRSFFIMHDSRPQIENTGYLINIGGFKVFHSGDNNGSDINEYEKLQLQNEQIDLAVLNYYGFWNTKEERMFTGKYIHPKRILLMHIPPAEIEIVKDSVKQVNDFIDITIFESSMKRKSFIYELSG